MDVKWNFHPRGEFINNLKTKAYRNAAFRAWLGQQKCFSCPQRNSSDINSITASHILRSYHGLKNHDWAAVPMCSACHWLYEYHRDDRYAKQFRLPDVGDAEKYFKRFLTETNRDDNRTPEQLSPI